MPTKHMTMVALALMVVSTVVISVVAIHAIATGRFQLGLLMVLVLTLNTHTADIQARLARHLDEDTPADLDTPSLADRLGPWMGN